MVRQAQKEGQAKAASPEVARVASSIKKKDAKDFASTKPKGLPKKKESAISEEGYDKMRDKKLERGEWKGGKSNYKAPYETDKQRSDRMKKSAANSMKALNIVKDAIRKKHGKGAIMGEENLSELDKKTLGSYVRKSSASMAGAAIDNDMKKVGKRYSGIQKATKKMAEHHEKDENGKVIEHEVEDTTPSSVEEAAYTGPDKKDRAVINKMYDKKGNKTDFAKKAAEYEKNMDPKKRQALKDKATKGMKFTHEDVKMSRKEYAKIHKDFKSDDPKNPRTTKYEKGKGTVSHPVKFTDEFEYLEKHLELALDEAGTLGTLHVADMKGNTPAWKNRMGVNKKGKRLYDFGQDLIQKMSYEPEGEMLEAKVDKMVPDHKRSGKRLDRYGNPHGSLALGGGIQRDRRADHADRRGKKTKGKMEDWRSDLGYIEEAQESPGPTKAMKKDDKIQETGVKNKITINPTVNVESVNVFEDAKMAKQSDDALAAAHKKFSSMDQTSPANKFMTKRISKEMNRRKKKVNEDIYRKKYDVKDGGYKKTTKMDQSNKRGGDSKKQNRELHTDLAKYGHTKTGKASNLKKGLASLKKESLLDQVAGAYVDEATRMKKEMGYDKGGSKKPKGPKPKDAALDAIKAKYKGQIMRSGSNQPKKVKGAKPSGDGKFKMMADKKKQTAADAKKRGFKNTKDYTNTMAVYGGKGNYDKGKGLGT